jgi:hypothetical protein
MNTKIMTKYILISIALVALVCSFAYADADSDALRKCVIDATSGYKDLSLSARVVFADKKVLKGIGKDFPKSFEIENTNAQFKFPDKMKASGKLGMIGIAVITNGGWRYYRVPSLKINKKVDISNKPEQRQSDLDLGVLSDTLWREWVIINAEKIDTRSGDQYKVTICRTTMRDAKSVCYIEAKTLKLLRIDKYHENYGALQVSYVFSGHTYEANAIWVPKRADVYNASGKLAASTAYENIRVNSGIPDSAFEP